MSFKLIGLVSSSLEEILLG
uniref:Uncharacterized protein n=1 Tax=Vitis vinifera TaxID=29760 RepID=F6HAC4_VITVI